MKRGMLKEHASLLNVAFYVADWLMIAISAWLAYWIYLGDTQMPGHYSVGVLIALLLSAWLFPRFSIYQAWRGASILDEMRLVSLAWGSVLLALTAFAFTTKMGAQYSRGWLGIWAFVGWFNLLVARLLLRTGLRWMRRHGFNQRHIVIVGSAGLGEEVAKRLGMSPWMGLNIVGYFHGDEDGAEGMADVPHIGGLDSVAGFVSTNGIEQVWIAMPLRDEDKVKWLLHELRHTTVDIRFVPDFFGLRLLNHSVMDVAGLPVMNLSVSPMSGMNVLLKDIEDRLLSLIILLAISPLMIFIAIGVKLTSPGPVFYRQKRMGWNGEAFTMYKFRSMKIHEEKNGTVTQATRDDPRVTPFGAFLRRTSLDELPQFINVLQGRMSIVGPRPHALEHNEQYKELIDPYMLRHKVKPGITGWAQVSGWRGETDTLEKMQKRVEFDLYYIEHWSLWFDIKIILMTLVKGFLHKNAY
jgi:putative colanic acid biosynthesis UDP-glucose lipid carrier transferase